jgi:hypothetical protein
MTMASIFLHVIIPRYIEGEKLQHKFYNLFILKTLHFPGHTVATGAAYIIAILISHVYSVVEKCCLIIY